MSRRKIKPQNHLSSKVKRVMTKKGREKYLKHLLDQMPKEMSEKLLEQVEEKVQQMKDNPEKCEEIAKEDIDMVKEIKKLVEKDNKNDKF